MVEKVGRRPLEHWREPVVMADDVRVCCLVDVSESVDRAMHRRDANTNELMG